MMHQDVINRTCVERIASEKLKIGQLKDEQWDIVHSIVVKRRDTILNAATGFGKSLTFQIIHSYGSPMNNPVSFVFLCL